MAVGRTMCETTIQTVLKNRGTAKSFSPENVFRIWTLGRLSDVLDWKGSVETASPVADPDPSGGRRFLRLLAPKVSEKFIRLRLTQLFGCGRTAPVLPVNNSLENDRRNRRFGKDHSESAFREASSMRRRH